MAYNLAINGVYWGYNPLIPTIYLTSWDIQVRHEIKSSPKSHRPEGPGTSTFHKKWWWNFSWGWLDSWGCFTMPFPSLKNTCWLFGVPGSYMSHEKKHLLLAMKSWLFNRDCYNDFLLSSHNWVEFHPAWTIALELPDIFVYLRTFVSSSPAILSCWICRSQRHESRQLCHRPTTTWQISYLCWNMFVNGHEASWNM